MHSPTPRLLTNLPTRQLWQYTNRKSALIVCLTILLILLIGWQVLFMHTSLSVNDRHYRLLIAADQASQEKGLSDRESLPTNEGMLFVFQGETVRCLWMKDMYFPLDMVWLNTSKQVVYIAANVLPSTYPETFCPSQPAAYVLELNAGQVQQAGIKLGEKLAF